MRSTNQAKKEKSINQVADMLADAIGEAAQSRPIKSDVVEVDPHGKRLMTAIVALLSPGATRGVIPFSPKLAKLALSRNRCNRRRDPRKVNRYSKDMLVELWEPNGNAICFDLDWYMNVGQHRMAAVVASNKTVMMDVAIGVSKKASYTTNDGQSGNNANALRQELGIERASAVVSWLAAFESILGGDPREMSPDDYVELYRCNKDAIDFIYNIPGFSKNDRRFKRASVMASFALAYLANPSVTKCFVNELRTGVYKKYFQAKALQRCDAVAFEALPPSTQADLVLYCLYHAIEGKSLPRVSLKDRAGNVNVLDVGRKFFVKKYEETA